MKALSWITNRHVVSALCAAPILLSCAYASAEDVAPAAAEPAPAYTLTYNLGLYSSYMFRGVDLSDGPALQGGVDWAHSSGFYLGTWWSNLDPYNNGGVPNGAKGNHLETDWYGGYAHTFENGLGVNFLGNYYWYPESHKINGDKDESAFEASVALSYKWFTYTYYRVLTGYYGALPNDGSSDTKGADYNEFKVNYKLPVGDLNFMTKIGYQHTPHLNASEGDFAIGLNRDFSIPSASGKKIDGFNAGGYFTKTFAVDDQAYYTLNSGTSDERKTNEDKLWFYVKRTW
jgi:uncharacterized protein (TIGR02001 family)